MRVTMHSNVIILINIYRVPASMLAERHILV